MGAFYSCKQRLLEKVKDFMCQCELVDDGTKAASIHQSLTIASRLLRHNKVADAAVTFAHAEELARTYNHLGLLDHALFYQTKFSEKLNLDYSTRLDAYRKNSVALFDKRTLELHRVAVKKEIAVSMNTGDPKNADDLIKRIYKDIQLTHEQMKDPYIAYELTAITRDALLSEKKYRIIEPFVIKMCSQLQEANVFNATNVSCEIDLMMLCAHALYRNLKFKECDIALRYIDNLAENADIVPLEHLPKMRLMRIEINFYTNRLKEATEMSLEALNDKTMKADTVEFLNLTLNCAVQHFAANNFREANARLITLPPDNYLREKISKEWVMKKDMIHMITQYHLGNDDVALIILGRVQSAFKELFTKNMYLLSGKFIELTKRIFTNRDVLKDTKFLSEVEQARKSWPKEQQDLHAITFYCWLKALIMGEDYYTVLMDRVNRSVPEMSEGISA